MLYEMKDKNKIENTEKKNSGGVTVFGWKFRMIFVCGLIILLNFVESFFARLGIGMAYLNGELSPIELREVILFNIFLAFSVILLFIAFFLCFKPIVLLRKIVLSFSTLKFMFYLGLSLYNLFDMFKISKFEIIPCIISSILLISYGSIIYFFTRPSVKEQFR